MPIVKAFQQRHDITDMVVVADAGMLSASNLRELDEAGLRFIVGSRVTKAPNDLASHFHWHGDLFTDGQVIDTITPRDQLAAAAKSSDPKIKAEPVWNPKTHTKSWREVWAYSTKRTVRDTKTPNLQEAKARAVVAGDKTTRTTRFVTIRNGAQELDEASLQRARRLVGLKIDSDPGSFTNYLMSTPTESGDWIATAGSSTPTLVYDTLTNPSFPAEMFNAVSSLIGGTPDNWLPDFFGMFPPGLT